MNKKFLIVGGLLVVAGVLAFTQVGSNLASIAGVGGFDEFGYNDKARIFNGTGASWCEAGGQLPDCMGIYSPDKLVMKWTADWDRGNDENWGNPPYDKAWTDNEWNGKGVKGGSGAVWHYKIKWVGECVANPSVLPEGSYCVWGQFAVLMDQGVDPNLAGPHHQWFAKATPNGYGSGN